MFAKEAGSRNDRIQARDGNALQSEAASSISSGLSIVGKIIGHGALTIFGHVEGEVRASTIVIAEGAQIEGKVSAEELTIGGYVKGTIHANHVTLNSTAVITSNQRFSDTLRLIVCLSGPAKFGAGQETAAI